MKHIPDKGDFFGKEHAADHKAFGFGGSVDGGGARPPFAADRDTHGPKDTPEPMEENGGGDYAHGGHVHPHGGEVVHTHHMKGGGMVCHYSHGGYSIHHADGHVSHHSEGGDPMSMPHSGIEAMHDSSEYAHRARGGMMGREPTLPRGMKPMVERHHSPIGGGMPVNRAPRNPTMTTSPRNAMPGGQSALGVEPSAEPDMAGSEQGIPQLRHGGRARK